MIPKGKIQAIIKPKLAVVQMMMSSPDPPFTQPMVTHPVVIHFCIQVIDDTRDSHNN
jgi:hypothetical protein